jgi:arginine decarboxylase
LLVPGEVFNRTIVEYLKFSRELNRLAPGFGTEIHGFVEQPDEEGRLRYYVDCVA